MTSTQRRRRIGAGVTTLVLAMSFACLGTTDGQAQRRSYRPPPEMGLRAGYEFRGKDWSVGAQARASMARGSDLIFSGDYYFISGTNFQLNMDLALPLMPGGGFYGGAGLGMAFTNVGVSSGLGTTIGANLLVGVAPYKSGRGGLHWFVEGRMFLRDGQNPLSLVVGLNAPLGG
jgi:hypothetical protein